jgi:hypothetical protein
MLFTTARPFVASAVIGVVTPISPSQLVLTSALANEQAPLLVSASPGADPEYYRHIDDDPRSCRIGCHGLLNATAGKN